MASQLRFEGPVLEDLLERVRTEVGSGARIVAANRVRKGGVGGFFAKEHFEVLVERGDEPASAPAVPAGARSADRRAAGRAAAAAAAAANGATEPAGPARVPRSILDLAEAVNEEERERDALALDDDGDGFIDLVEDRPPVSTQTSAFAAMLERITEETDALVEGTGDEHGTGVDGTGDGEPFVVDERFTTRHASLAAAREAAARNPHAADEITIDDEPAMTPRNGTAAAPATTTPAPVRDELPAAAAPDATASRERRAPARRGEGRLLRRATTTPVAPEELAAPVFRRMTREAPVIERPENLLANLGVPARLVPRGVGWRELNAALVDSLARLPAPPLLPDAPGVVVAVVGSGDQPMALARDLADDLGIDPDRVVLATPEPVASDVPAWLQVCDPETAEERRRSWRRRPYPTVVAISLTSGRDQLDWARSIIDNIEPTCTWTIVEAAWKSEDVQYWSERLGGTDVLALSGLGQTVSPAAVLDLGIAVGRLEDRPATAVTWADMLMARMAHHDPDTAPDARDARDARDEAGQEAMVR